MTRPTTLTDIDPMLKEPLTVKRGDLCKGPLCKNTVTGKAEYCGQSCRNNALAFRTVARMLAGMSDQQAVEVLRSWRTYKHVYREQL